MRNIDDIVKKIKATVESHYLGDGAYSRYLWQNDKCTRKMGINEYGCADAMNILYSICAFPRGEHREACLCALRSLQEEDSGLFTEDTHHPIHTTAHCMAAIELFDEQALYKPRALDKHFTCEGVASLLDSLDWEGNPWPQSHQGAGIYVIGCLSDSVDAEWKRFYFKYLYDRTDPLIGMSRAGTLNTGKIPEYAHLYGWFHYTFNMEYAKMPQRYPERLIDTCIRLFDNGELGKSFGRYIGFAEIDWVYTLNRCTRQTPHRFLEAKDRLRKFAHGFIEYLESIDWEKDDGVNDLHMLFGTVCALAELQAALPGEIETGKPLRLVLDRRPFI